MENIIFFLGLSVGLVTVGAAGIVCALAQYSVMLTDAYWLFPLWLTATCAGWLVGVVLQFSLARREATVEVVLKEQRAYAMELSSQEREMIIRERLAVIAQPPEQDAAGLMDAAWQVAAHRFVVAGDRLGFSIRTMVTAGVCSWDGWSALVALLSQAGVLVRSPRAGWAAGWDMGRWQLERHTINLPYPPTAPPEVELQPNGHVYNAHNSPNSAPEGVRTVDG